MWSKKGGKNQSIYGRREVWVRNARSHIRFVPLTEYSPADKSMTNGCQRVKLDVFLTNSSDCGFYFDLVVFKKVHGDYRETRKFMQLFGESGSKRSIIEGRYAKAKRFTP